MAQARQRFQFSFVTLIPVAVLVAGACWINATSAAPQKSGPSPAPASPPVAPLHPVTDEYFGAKVEDPYRYMENLKDPKVAAWFKAQNTYTRSVLDSLPGRAALLARIQELDNAIPARVTDVHHLPGRLYFYQKRLANEDLPKIYFRERLIGEEKVLVDPAKYRAPGKPHYSISYYSPSPDGRYVAFGISPAGSEDAVLRIMNVQTGRETGDIIDRAQFGSPSWLPDGRSIVYNRLQRTGPKSAPTDRYLNSRAYLHTIGTSPERDRMAFGTGSPGVQIAPSDIPFVGIMPGTDYAVGVIAHGVQNEITAYIAPLESLKSASVPWKKLCDVGDEITGFDAKGDDLFLLSHLNASRFKVLRTHFSNPDVVHAEVVIPPGKAVIRNIAATQDALYVQELDGGIGRLVRLPYGENSKPTEIVLPFPGALTFQATDQRVPGLLMDLTAWTRPSAIYAYDPDASRFADTKLQPAPSIDLSRFEIASIEVKAESYDGTDVPLSIIYKSRGSLNGRNPTILQAYGAYGITLDPHFDPRMLAWFERRGMLAVAHVRGGGEYGEDWHVAGKQSTKPNTWKDVFACAKFLFVQRYTSPAYLAVEGGSAGGITVGRAITEHPEMFAAAIDAVPMSDVVRTEFTPNGPPNIPEFGSVKTEEGFKALYEMSAYHHIKDGTAYPAVLVTTGFNDPRVISWEPGKMAARLQAATSSGKPVLLRVDYEAGHGFGSTKTQGEQELADELSFALWQFGDPDFQPEK